jgi:hypothetical protein
MRAIFRILFLSCIAIFCFSYQLSAQSQQNTAFHPPTRIVMTSPIDGATDVDIYPVFDWHHAPSVGVPDYYQIIISTNQHLFAPIIDTTVPYPIAYYRVTAHLAANQTYYWSVIPKNSWGAANRNLIWSFTTGDFYPDIVDVEDDFFHDISDETSVDRQRKVHSRTNYYFDIGVGGGIFTHIYDGKSLHKEDSYDGDDHGLSFGTKVGIRLARPLYLSVEFALKEQEMRFVDDHPEYGMDMTSRFSQYFIAPGLIYYPFENIQLATSIGYSAGKTKEKIIIADEIYHENYGIEGGLAFSVSLGVDILRGRHSAILGIAYFQAQNQLNHRDLMTETITLFLKYRLR